MRGLMTTCELEESRKRHSEDQEQQLDRIRYSSANTEFSQAVRYALWETSGQDSELCSGCRG